MKNILAVLFLVLLFGCGARKTKTDISKTSGTSNIDLSQTTSMQSKTEGVFTKNQTITDLGYGFSIEPINGQNSFFTLKSGNDSVQVKTNAKVSFNKNNKKEQTDIKYKYETVTTFISKMTYKSHTTYYSYHKQKETEKKAYPWWLFVIFGMVITFVLMQIINKNTFVSLWNRLTNKKL